MILQRVGHPIFKKRTWCLVSFSQKLCCGAENDLRPPHGSAWVDEPPPPDLLCNQAHASSPSWSGFCSSLLHTPPPRGRFLAIRIHLLSSPVNFCACPLPQAFSILCSPPRSASGCLSLSFPLFSSHSISVSQFLILRFSQTRSQQPHWGEAVLL